MTDDTAILEKIRMLMGVGTLPTSEPSRRRIGILSARVCDACGKGIQPTETGVEIEFWKTIAVNLHRGCAKIYDMELQRRGYGMSG